MRYPRLFPILVAFLHIAGGSARADEILVFAASSTTGAISDINSEFRAGGANTARASFASTGILARQIENGAPAHVLISANADWIDHLARRQLLAPGTRIRVAANRLVLIAPSDSSLSVVIRPQFEIVEALGRGRLAIADPAHSPAGIYARAALSHYGVWKRLARRTARAANVRQALILVEQGEAPLGIVYATDARASARVRVVDRFPTQSHPTIRYEAALIAGNTGAAARAYLALLSSARGRAIFRRHGFLVE